MGSRGIRIALLACLALAVWAASHTRREPEDDLGAADRAAAAALRALPYVGSEAISSGAPSGVLRRDPERSAGGPRLFTTQLLGRAELIDADGAVLRSWSHPPSLTWEQAELLPGGDLLVVAAEGSAQPEGERVAGIPDGSRTLLRLDWEGNLIWKRRLLVHHDVALAPGGKLAVLAFERVRRADLHPSIPVRDERVLLLDPDGTLLDSRSLLAAVEAGGAPFEWLEVAPDRLTGTEWIDLFHANSIEWMHGAGLADSHELYAPTNLLLCLRHQDRVVVLDWARGALVWSWGAGELSGPHDAHLLTDGHILLFDNGLARRSSRGVEIDPLSGEIVWEYRPDPSEGFFTASKGSIQRLDNGNTLLAASDRGRAIEVTPAGEIVWEFVCPHRTRSGRRAAIVRMKCLPPAYVEAIIAARATGEPATGEPAPGAAFDAMVR
ncbi:MAG: arylsulfotransferase family protein [Planctomycetota bacterium]|nr:arylsulfotransferase family protein [Planctomycetota bacterium]